jgi:predicted phage terminase large subunit-like protein
MQPNSQMFGRLADALATSWRVRARPEQLAPAGDWWSVWLALAGRGWGKTRTGTEWVHEHATAGSAGRIALVAPTAADVRDVLIEGPSGFLAIASESTRPRWEPSKRRLEWPNGAVATAYSAEEPERLRGPQHDLAFCDEAAAWKYPEAMDMLLFGLRVGQRPRMLICTTPRPTKLLRDLLAREGKDVAITRGRTMDNAENLAPTFLSQIVSKYEGTRLGRQELNGELLEDVAGALWQRAWLDRDRVEKAPPLKRIVVAIDPAISTDEGSDLTGIVVCGIGENGEGYVLQDLSGKFTPDEWARRAVAAYHRWSADRIVAEKNQGGQMVESVIRQVEKNIPYRAVHASRGKAIRAEPISALFEQGRCHLVGSSLSELEDELCSFSSDFDRASAGYSPDRLDAMVWAFTELMLKIEQPPAVFGIWGMNVEPLLGQSQGPASKHDGQILTGILAGGHAVSR